MLALCLGEGSRRFQQKFGREHLIILKDVQKNKHKVNIIPYQRSKPLGIGKRQPVVKRLKRERTYLHWEMEHSEIIPELVPNTCLNRIVLSHVEMLASIIMVMFLNY